MKDSIVKLADEVRKDLRKLEELEFTTKEHFWTVVLKHFLKNKHEFESLNMFKDFVQSCGNGTGFWSGQYVVPMCTYHFDTYKKTVNEIIDKQGYVPIEKWEWYAPKPKIELPSRQEFAVALSGLINDLKNVICKQECNRVSDITIAAVVGEKLHIEESIFYKTAKFLNDEYFAMLVQSHIKGSLLIHNSSVNDTSVLLDAIKRSYRASTNNNCPPFEFGDNGTNKMKP